MAEDTSPDLMPTMINVYLNELGKRVEEMENAINAEDYFQISEIAHAVKSASGTFGAEILYDKAKLLECKAKEHDNSLDEITYLVNDIQEAINVTRNTYHAYQLEF